MQTKKSKFTENFCENLRRARGDRSQADFARFLGLSSQVTYHNYETGRIPKQEILMQIADKLGCDASNLFKENLGVVSELPSTEPIARPGQSRMSRRVPVVSWAEAGKGGNFSDLAEQIDESVDTDCKDQNAFALTIEGDSMEPRFEAGDTVVFAPNNEPRNGDFVVARLAESGAVLFKKFRRTGAEGQTIRLESLNPHYAPQEYPASAFRFIYPAVEFRAKLR